MSVYVGVGRSVWIEYMCQYMWVLGGRCGLSIIMCQCMWMLGGRCGLSICVSVCGCWAVGVD